MLEKQESPEKDQLSSKDSSNLKLSHDAVLMLASQQPLRDWSQLSTQKSELPLLILTADHRGDKNTHSFNKTTTATHEHNHKEIHEHYEHGDKHKTENRGQTDDTVYELNWRGKKISLKTCDGVPSQFKDENGKEWTSPDGKSWTRENSDGIDAWQGQIKFDSEKQELKISNLYGLETTYKADGSQSIQFQTKDGDTVSQTKYADGRQEIKNKNEVWTSNDGKSWSNGQQLLVSDMQIDAYGRLLHHDQNGKEIYESQSAQQDKINEKMQELSQKYNVRFGKAGELITQDDDKTNKKLELRMPTAEELKVIESILPKYAHVARKNGTDFGGLKFNFVTPNGEGAKVTEHGWHEGGKNPSISFAPRDAAKTNGWDGLEGTALHEIAHQLQEVRWKDNAGEEHVPKKVEDFFGYKKVMPPLTSAAEGTYRLSDKEGKQWQYESVSNKDEEQEELWMPVKNGKVQKDSELGISEEQLRNRMADNKKPATDYFFHPQEAHAEAMALMLFDAKTLWQKNPDLYNATKKWDQEDINYRYGFQKNAAGEQIPRMIRDIDRNLVPNTDESRKRIHEWEKTWQSQKAEKHATLPSRGRCACHA